MAISSSGRSGVGTKVYIGVLGVAMVIAAWSIAISADGIAEPATTATATAKPAAQAVATTSTTTAPKPTTGTEPTPPKSRATPTPARTAAAAPAVVEKAQPVKPAGGPKVTVIDLPVRPVEPVKAEPRNAAAKPTPEPEVPDRVVVSARPDGGMLQALAMVPIPGAEIVAFDSATNAAFVTCQQGIAVVQLWEGSNAALLRTIDAATGLAMGPGAEVTHVAIDPAGRGILAATVIPADRAGIPGQVVFLSTRTGAVVARATVGYGPDAAAFSPDGSRLVVVNEGEARPLAMGGLNDPPGSVSIIDLRGLDSANAFGRLAQDRVATRHFDGPAVQAALIDSTHPLRIHPANRATPSLDLEPESVVVVGSRAFVVLQENNGIAAMDLDTLAWSAVSGLGLVERELDPSDQDGPIVRATVASLPMPDQVAAFTAGGRTLLVIAEEGDDRGEFGETMLGDQARFSTLAKRGRLDPGTASELDLSDTGLGRLHVCAFTGDTTGDGLLNRPHALGARSIGIYDAGTLQRLSDTGSQFERILGDRLVAIGRDKEADARSDRRGPEPEGVTIATIGDRPIAFVTLERPGAIAIVDLSDVDRPRVVDIIPTVAHGGVGPEGLAYIDGASSPNGSAMLLVGFEASGALGIYRVDAGAVTAPR